MRETVSREGKRSFRLPSHRSAQPELTLIPRPRDQTLYSNASRTAVCLPRSRISVESISMARLSRHYSNSQADVRDVRHRKRLRIPCSTRRIAEGRRNRNGVSYLSISGDPIRRCLLSRESAYARYDEFNSLSPTHRDRSNFILEVIHKAPHVEETEILPCKKTSQSESLSSPRTDSVSSLGSGSSFRNSRASSGISVHGRGLQTVSTVGNPSNILKLVKPWNRLRRIVSSTRRIQRRPHVLITSIFVQRFVHSSNAIPFALSYTWVKCTNPVKYAGNGLVIPDVLGQVFIAEILERCRPTSKDVKSGIDDFGFFSRA